MEKIYIRTNGKLKDFKPDINYVISFANKLKPIAEGATGVRLEDIIIKDRPIKNNEGNIFSYEPDCMVLNTDFIYPNYFDTEEEYNRLLEVDIAHEIGHLVSSIISPSVLKFLFNRIFVPKKGIAMLKIAFGFPEYFIDMLPKGTLSEDAIKFKRTLIYSKEPDTLTGYYFLCQVSRILGKEEAFNVVKNPKVTLEELENPDLYIERRRK